MIVCSCYGVSDRTVREAVADGAESILDVTMACDAGGGCGSCHDTLRVLLAEGCASRRACAA